MFSAKEGDIYKIVSIYGREFELRYGYYDDSERESDFSELIPIYPDFLLMPVYDDDGRPFVTQMQSLCEYGDSTFEDGCCVDCKHYIHGDELLGVCDCEFNRKNV